MATTETGFNSDFTDGDEFYDEKMYGKGWIQLWRPAPYHWVAMHIERRIIFSYCEGDLSKTKYDSEEEFLKGLQETKDWWVKNQGDSANPVLCGSAEPYGFLTGNKITLNPPKCDKCGSLTYPDVGEEENRQCLRCDL